MTSTEPTSEPSPEPSPEMMVVDSPYELANWRPLVNWVLYIPHSIVLYALRLATGIVWFLYWLILVFTGRLNPGLYGFLAMYERYNTRAGGFLIGYSEQYPPFDFDMSSPDNDAYPPIRVNLPEPAESTSRVAAFNFLLAIPHYFWLMIVGIGVFFIMIAAWFAVLFTGSWPQGMRDFTVRFGNYWLRIWAYTVMVETKYPSFRV